MTTGDCSASAVAAFREGTGFIAPNVKTKRKGMAPSSFNKCVDTLRALLEIAYEQSMVYENPAEEVQNAPKRQKHLELPSSAQFQAIMKKIAASGSRWLTDAADLVRRLHLHRFTDQKSLDRIRAVKATFHHRIGNPFEFAVVARAERSVANPPASQRETPAVLCAGLGTSWRATIPRAGRGRNDGRSSDLGWRNACDVPACICFYLIA